MPNTVFSIYSLKGERRPLSRYREIQIDSQKYSLKKQNISTYSPMRRFNISCPTVFTIYPGRGKDTIKSLSRNSNRLALKFVCYHLGIQHNNMLFVSNFLVHVLPPYTQF